MDLYVVSSDGTTVASRVHAAVLVCVKTAAILGAVLSLGPLKEEDYMRLVKQSLEGKDRLVRLTGCEHSWPCFGKPAIIFHDRGKIFTSERARQVLVDRLGIITEQAPPYAPSAKGTVEALFRWMTERFEKRLPNSSYGVHDAETAAQAGGMTLEELERCFYQAIVDDYLRDFDTLRQHDEEQAKLGREQGLPVRARIQNEAGAARRRRSAEIRASEQARQWDRQRQDIHPAIVSEHLASIEAKKLAPPKLPPAVPDAEQVKHGLDDLVRHLGRPAVGSRVQVSWPRYLLSVQKRWLDECPGAGDPIDALAHLLESLCFDGGEQFLLRSECEHGLATLARGRDDA